MPRRKTTRRSRRRPKEEGGDEGKETGGGGDGGGEGREGGGEGGPTEGGRVGGEDSVASPDGERRVEGGELDANNLFLNFMRCAPTSPDVLSYLGHTR